MAFSQYGQGYLLPNLIFHQFGFQSHNFRSRNAKKAIMGSNDLNYSLVSNKTLSKKLGHWFDAQGLMTSDKMREPTPIMTSPTKKPKP